VVCSAECDAGPWGKALREGAEALVKRSGKLAREGAEEGLESAAARKALREGLEAATEKVAGRIGGKVVREASRKAGALVVRVSDDVARPIVGKFGDDGARALGSVSTRGAKRLAAMADELEACGRGRDWMRLVAERGDEVTEWLWKRRRSVAIGTIATAVVLQPEEFVQASERVATSTIQYVAAPIAERAATAIPWGVLWTIAILGGGCWLVAKRGLARLRHELVSGSIRAVTHIMK